MAAASAENALFLSDRIHPEMDRILSFRMVLPAVLPSEPWREEGKDSGMIKQKNEEKDE